jgi:hypothetical protein
VNVCYLDCFSGVSGDKTVAAFLDLGMPVEYLMEQLEDMKLGNYRIDVESLTVHGIAAMRMNVRVLDVHVVRTWASVRELLESSRLAPEIKERALAIFADLARAEAIIHAKPLELVHFHEVGAVDSIVDIVGAAAALSFFGLDKVISSPVAVGSGMVRTDHGSLPVPAPATLELLKEIPTYSGGETGELTTPTGAAILKNCVDEYGDMPVMKPHGIGYGAGTRDFDVPNVLRIVYGELVEGMAAGLKTGGPVDLAAVRGQSAGELGGDLVTVIETTVDNTSPQILGAVFDLLLEEGALDVWTTPVQMKKQRPGTLLTVLAPPERAPALQMLLLRETETIGMRVREERRVVAPRELVDVDTSLGSVRVKIARAGGQVVSVMPEFDDVKRLAKARKLPVKTAFDQVKREAEARLAGAGESPEGGPKGGPGGGPGDDEPGGNGPEVA